MSRFCHFLLRNGKSPPRISDVQESDDEVCIALVNRFGDDVLSVHIEDRIINLERFKNRSNAKSKLEKGKN